MRNFVLFSTLAGLGYSLPQAVTSSPYKLTKSYTADNLLDSFDFIEGLDVYNGGSAQYQGKDAATSSGLAKVDNGKVYLGADATTVIGDSSQGRPSIRLQSRETFNGGLLVADFDHFPAKGCGMWPAFWALRDGAEYSEIDIIEATSLANKNAVTLFTSVETCSMSLQQPAEFTEGTAELNCAVTPEMIQAGQGGCSVEALPGTFGEESNAKGAGIWALQLDDNVVKAWYFPRERVPADLQSGDASVPDPSTWGTPVMNFASAPCDLKQAFNDMKIIININFCGGYTTSAWNGYDEGRYNNCAAHTGYAGDPKTSCEAYVRENPEAFDETYFLINSIRVFEHA